MNEHKFNILKKEAEKLAGKIPEAKSVVSGLNKLLNELEVYQYELEAQNNEIKETRNALEELYNRYYGLFDAGPVGKLILDDKLMVREVNNSAMKILGKSRQLIIERHIQLFISQKSKEQFSLALNNSIKTGNRAVVELFVKSNTHSDKYCRFYIEPFKHNNPDLYLTIAITDETEIRKIKDELDIAKEKFGILENLPDPVFVFAKEKVVYVNQAVKQVLGVDPESLIGFNIFSILNDELRELAIVNYTKKSDGEKTTNREMDFTKPDGTIINIMVNSRLINYSGETYSIGIVRDISDVKAKEAKLEESRKIYDIITSNMTDIIAQVDADGTVRYVSPSITNTLGIRPADIIGTSMFKYLAPDERKFIKAVFVNAIQEKDRLNVRHKFINIAGEVELFETVGKIIRVGGEAKSIILSSRPISSQVEAERKSFESESRFNTLLETIKDLVFILDIKGSFIYANSAFYPLTEYKPEELIGSHFSLLVHPDYHEETKANFTRGLNGNETPTYEINIITKAGGTTPIELKVTNLLGQDGKPIGRIGMGRDIRERKKQEEIINRQNLFLSSILDNLPVGVFTKEVSEECAFVLWNKKMEKLYGLSPAEVIGKRNDDLFRDEMRDRFNLQDKKLLSGLKPIDIEENTFINNNHFVYRKIKIPVFNKSGKCEYILGIVEDITDKKISEIAIQSAKSRLEHLIKSSPSIIYSCKPSGSFENTFISANCELLLGYQTDELTGKEHFDENLIHPDDKDYIYKEVKKLKLLKYLKIEYRLKRQDGSYRWVKDEMRFVKDPAGNPIELVGAWIDINDAKIAELALAESEEKFRMLNESIEDVFILVTPDKELLYISPAYEKIFGRSTDFVYNNPSSFLDLIHPDDLDRIKEKYDDPGDWNIDEEYRIITHLGELKWIQARYFPVHDSKGKLKMVAGIAKDITKQKEFEHALISAKEKAEESAIAKNEFLANIGHEIRSPLNPIIGFSELMLNEYKLPERVNNLLSMILSSGKSLLNIINELLDLSKIESGKMSINEETISIRSFLQDLLGPLIDSAKKSDIELIYTVDDKVPDLIITDPMRLWQIVSNLAGNAIKFSNKPGEKVKVIVERGMHDGNDMLVIKVIDRGIGIPADKKELIFEIFSQVDSSSTRKYGGTGIGLAIVKKIVDLMHGRIMLYTMPGSGSEFIIYLPLKTSAPAAPPNSHEIIRNEKNIISAGVIELLVAEDEDSNRMLISNVLGEFNNLHIHYADNGLKAVELYKERNIKLILMDVKMPVLDGIKATGIIRNFENTHNMQRVKIIGITAQAIQGMKETLIEAGMDEVIFKPYDINILRALIKEQILMISKKL